VIKPSISYSNSKNEYKNDNLPKKDMNNSCISNLDWLRDALPFCDNFEKHENSFKSNNLYCPYNKKYNGKIIKDRKTDAIFAISQKEKLGN
jgi:hypothetical protein